MTHKWPVGLAVAVVLSVCCGSLLAHHNSAAMYDQKNPVTLQGKVVEFRMINPHSRLVFEVKQADGSVAKWEAEGGSPSAAYRRGWRVDDLKPGDSFTIIGSPAVDGSRKMEIEKLITTSGKELE